ncbi:MAG: hypothetical protein GX463_05855 [Methanothrix sp.]|nr:hypothetical protein [Methanothrix sp.]HNU40779.1 hypothetical protein [Methanothrix sp.]
MFWDYKVILAYLLDALRRHQSETAAALEVAICRLEALPLNGARAK